MLVTGTRGFIGSHVARLLVCKGHEVYGLTRGGQRRCQIRAPAPGVHETQLDLEQQAAVRKAIAAIRPECAIHLAWYAVPGKYWTAPENLNCVAMTLLLTRALAECGCNRLVATGSCAEYDWSYEVLSEEKTPINPRTLYGICKNASRSMLESYCAGAAMQFAWARLFFLYGPGEAEHRLVPATISALVAGRIPVCTRGEQKRDFLHVEDVAAAICAVALSQVVGPINIGSGEPVPVRTVVETLATILDCSPQVSCGTLPYAADEPSQLRADVRRLKTETDWNPRFTLRAGLENTVAWWRKTKK